MKQFLFFRVKRITPMVALLCLVFTFGREDYLKIVDAQNTRRYDVFVCESRESIYSNIVLYMQSGF